MLFAFAAWSMTDMILFTITAFLLLSLPSQWRYHTLVSQVSKSLPPHADEQTRLQMIIQHISASRLRQPQRAEHLLGERITRWRDEAFVAAELASRRKSSGD